MLKASRSNSVVSLESRIIFSLATFSPKNFEDKLFTLESDYNDIIIQLKERAKEILEKTLGNIDILNFEQIFLSFNTTKNILGENKL